MEECPHCSQMKAENRLLRKSITETSKQYVLVVNETLALRRYIETVTGITNPILDTV